ncbi:tetraacyldisaccharide 4'-kinase [Pseudidiomarina sp.]|uniref:tetraacyldisaccharide 4'-kinase n=1 Tax=Pseudidiomarina sp. TaxID=2081707 RepID=UPI003A96B66B
MFWQRAWYRSGLDFRLILLWPLMIVFIALSWLRRALYRIGVLPTFRAPVPVIIIGNISVGGTGKTPVTEAVVKWAQNNGYSPAIVSRGYGGKGPFPQCVTATSPAEVVGDEPKLLAQRTGVPIVVSPNRKQAISKLLHEAPQVNLIISDDGLQHYRLARDIEIVVIDGERGLGNGWRLPLGPLRESKQRLTQADIVVQNGGAEARYGWRFSLQPGNWRRVRDEQEVPVPQGESIAVAGIGNPQRFFDTLKQAGVTVTETYAYADHHPFSATDFASIDPAVTVLMTEKDAAKCQAFAQDNWFYLPVSAKFEDGFWQQLQARLQKVSNKE